MNVILIKKFIDRQIIDPNSDEFQKLKQSIEEIHLN